MYEIRFQIISTACKNFVSELEEIYGVRFTPAQLNQEVSKYLFRDYDANPRYHDDNDLYSLQKSRRYAGL